MSDSDHLLETILSPNPNSHASPAQTIDGIVIGIIAGLANTAEPTVAFPGNQQEQGIKARTTVALTADMIGRQVALMFEQGDPTRPLVLGLIQNPEPTPQTMSARLDDERIELRAEREIVLRCGKASITLTRAGKIIIRGAYLLSRSSGVNRIKGGSVQLN